MTLTSATVRVQYLGDGATTSFPITYDIWNEDDPIVVHTDSNGVETTWVRGTQYNITLTNPPATATLVVVTLPTDHTPASGEKLTIKSNLANTQPTSLPLGGSLPSASVEQQFDQTVRQVQQSIESIGRSLKFPVSDASSLTSEMPSSASRASKYLTFDGSGNPTATDAATASGTSVTATGSTTARLLADRFAEVINVKDYGAVGDGITDDTAAIQAALDAAPANSLILGNPTDIYLCGSSLSIPSNVTLDGRWALFKRNFLGGFFIKNSTADTTNDNTNIKLYRVSLTDNGNASRGSFLEMIGVTGLRIAGLNVVGTAAYDTVNAAWSCYLSGEDIILDDIYIDTTLCTQWSDGIHLGYVKNFSMNNFVITAGDDAIALHYPNSSWTNSGANTASDGINIGNGVVSSEIANAIRIGADSLATHGGNAGAASVFKNVHIHDIVSTKVGTAGRQITLLDDRASADISDQHDNIKISNFKCLKATIAGIVQVKGNPDPTNSANYTQHNFGRIVFENSEIVNDATGATFLGGGADEITISGGKWERTVTPSAFGGLQFQQITTLKIIGAHLIASDTGTGMALTYVENTHIYDSDIEGSGSEFQLLLLNKNSDIAVNLYVIGGSISNADRLLTNAGAGTITDYIIVAVDLHAATFSKIGAVAATRYRAVIADEMVNSDGATGGAGSAGAGNQYIELDVGGTVYKVLHDGTV